MMEDDNYTPLVVCLIIVKNASTSRPTYLSPGIQGSAKFMTKPFNNFLCFICHTSR